MKIETYKIKTCMGSVTKFGEQLPFLNENELETLNEIGYTGKLDGIETSRETYLNTLNKGQFDVRQLKFDNGNFCEEFMITRVNL